MSVPEAVVSYLLDNITQLLSDHYHLAADARENVVDLQGELTTLKSLISDFSRYNYDSSDFLKTAVVDIKKVLEESEDVLDSYMLTVVQKKKSFVSRTFLKVTGYPTGLREVAKEVKRVAAKVRKVLDRKAMSGFAALGHQAANYSLPKKTIEAPKVEEEHVIGFDDAARDVQALLTKGPEQLEVVSIVGMLGLGKTTLATKVYKDATVDYEFMIRAFVYVSQEYDKKKVLLKILRSFTNVNDEVVKMDETELENHLRKELEGKQYLIVLDDVWNSSDWDNFKGAFPNNQKRCRVLLTTRHEFVAKHANQSNVESHYKLAFLEHDECRELLRWKVFKKNSCPQELMEYEINIVKKCNGLPLAVVVIAGILVNQPERAEWWKEVEKSVENFISRGELAGVVIDVMYKHLPNYLKPCFLYLGVFREDFEIPVWKLIRLLISEGLVEVGDGDFNLEIRAEQYLNELVYRNLVMVGQRRSNGRMKTCHMHDTLREFCKREAASQNLFHEIKKGQSDSTFNKCRRLCINNADSLAYITVNPSGEHIRSFLTFVKEETPMEPKPISSLLKTYKFLRVLEVQCLFLSRFPNDLCSLVLLKYVALSFNLHTIPAAFSAMYFLQTLIVKTTSRALEIKVDLWKMPHFRHLHTNASASLPATNETLEEAPNDNVQTLCTISPESCKEVYVRSPKIRKLGIYGALNKLSEVHAGSSFLTHLRNLESLENLKLNDEFNNNPFSLPSVKEFPKKLTKLTLMNTQLDWKEISTLGQLESLEVLKLKEYAFKGPLWQTEKGGFLVLKHLYIGHTDLMVWEASVEHFPKLQSLELNSCDKLQAFPHGLAVIPSLQSVVLHCTNARVAYSARKLHVLRLKQAEEVKGQKKQAEFKLSVYPPDH